MQTKLAVLICLVLMAPASTLRAETATLSTPHAGKIWLDLAPEPTSSIGVDPAALEAVLCNLPMPESQISVRGGGGSEDCRLVVGGPGSQSRSMAMEITILTYLPRALSRSAEITVRPTDLALPGAGVVNTVCGDWTYEAHLRPEVAQATSRIVLEEPPIAGVSGLFVGTLRIAAEVTFADSDFTTTKTLEVDLELDAAGRWTFLPPGSTVSGASDLALFVDQNTSGARDRPGCAKDRHRCGILCFTAQESTVELANGIIP